MNPSRRQNFTGSAVTVVAIILLIGLFWGFNWLTHWNTMFFSNKSEDLIKDVYTTTYHVAYDDGMAICNAMNYPYGEYYTFTGLLRLHTSLPDGCSNLRIIMRNKQMRPSPVMFHHLLVRPEGMHVPFVDGQRYIDNIPLKD